MLKFCWGTDIPHLQTVHLKHRPLHPQSTRAGQSGPPNTNAGYYASHRLLGNEICRLFNGRRGCKLTSCRFEHVCSVKGCSQAHPVLEHTLTKSKNHKGEPFAGFASLYQAWEKELEADKDRSFILSGIKHGFDIIDPNSIPKQAQGKNHNSASQKHPFYHLATAQIELEIKDGNYIEVDIPPIIVSPPQVGRGYSTDS